MDGTIILSTQQFKFLLGEVLEAKLNEKLKGFIFPPAVQTDSPGEYLTTKDLADKFHCCELTIHNLRKKGLIPYKKYGRKYLFKATELDIIGTVVKGKL